MKRSFPCAAASLLFVWSSFGQGEVTGSIAGGDGSEGLAGVHVQQKETSTRTISDSEGTYRIQVSDGEATLVFSFEGYQTFETIVGSRSEIDVLLAVDTRASEQKVVTAYGIERRMKALGYPSMQVSGDNFEGQWVTNLGTSLSGRFTGVSVTPPSTGIAGSSLVTIRGGSSILGNDQPLYVVNGVPIDNTNFGVAGPLGGSDGGDGLSSFNPHEIESISVLRGYAGTAIYGVRASNGVVLITTKSAKDRADKGIEITYNSDLLFARVYNHSDWQTKYGVGSNGAKPTSAQEALEDGLFAWGSELDGSDVVQYDGVTRPYEDRGETIRDFYETGITWANSLSLQGTAKNAFYRFTVSDLSADDVMPNSDFSRRIFSTRFGSSFGKLNVQIWGQYSKEDAKNRPRVAGTPGNANFTALLKPADHSFEDYKGQPNANGILKLGASRDGSELRHQGQTRITNPYWAAYQFHRRDLKDRFLGNISATFNFNEWFYVRARLGTDYISRDAVEYTPYGTAYRFRGDFYTGSRIVQQTNADVFIGAKRSLGPLDFDLLLMGNRMRSSSSARSIMGSDLIIPYLHTTGNLRSSRGSYESSQLGINSVFAGALVGYKDFLFLNLGIRKDWISTLSSESNDVLYPGLGVSLVISDMVALPSWFTLLKFNGSLAQVGGSPPTPYLLHPTFSSVSEPLRGAFLSSLSTVDIPDPALKPLKSREWEGGFNARFFHDRIELALYYYVKNTFEAIVPTPISRTSGFTYALINDGETKNYGPEIELGGVPVRTDNFEWKASVNFAYNEHKSVKLSGEPDEKRGEDDVYINRPWIDVNQSPSRFDQMAHIEGLRLNKLLGTGYKRDVNGNIIHDSNGLPMEGFILYSEEGKILQEGGLMILGNARQSLYLGVLNELNYLGFNLGVFVDIRQDASIISGTNSQAYYRGLHSDTLKGRQGGLKLENIVMEVEDAEGNSTLREVAEYTIPEEMVDDYYQRISGIAEHFAVNSSFIKLREVSLGYSFPERWLSPLAVESVRLSAVGRNLFVIDYADNIDPESGYTHDRSTLGLEYFSLPAVRNFGFRLGVTF